MPVCCKCNRDGACKKCSCTKKNQTCSNCLPLKLGRCCNGPRNATDSRESMDDVSTLKRENMTLKQENEGLLQERSQLQIMLEKATSDQRLLNSQLEETKMEFQARRRLVMEQELSLKELKEKNNSLTESLKRIKDENKRLKREITSAVEHTNIEKKQLLLLKNYTSSMVAQAMGIYSSMVKPSSDVGTHDSKEESENTDFHHQMEEIAQQVENQSFISKQPADVKIAPVGKSDVSSLFPSPESSAGGPHKEGSPHMTLADSLTRRKTNDL